MHSIRVIIIDSFSLCLTSFLVAFLGSKAFLTQGISRPSFLPPFHILLFFFGDLNISTTSYPLSDDLIDGSRGLGLLLIGDLKKRMHLLANLFLLGHFWKSKLHEKREVGLAFKFVIGLAGRVDELEEIVSALLCHVN